MDFDRLLGRYESGEISRQELVDAMRAAVAGAPGAAAGTGPAAASAAPAEGATPRAAEVCSVQTLNHVTVFVDDVASSVEFHQRLLGMPVLTRQGEGVNLQVGSGFFGIYPATRHPVGIHHVCFGVEGFEADAVLERLEAAGVEGKLYHRGETKELYFTDPAGIRVQLQDVRYRGGVGPLGDRDPG